MNKNKIVRDLLKTRSHINIQLGGGGNSHKRFINVDIRDGSNVDVVHDLETYPWPFPDNCAGFLVASHIVEHINPAKGGFIKWMDEAWRILKIGGQMMVATPYAGSLGYWQDPTHVNGCNEVTWYYFDPIQKLDRVSLYRIYKPKPWKVVNIAWAQDANLEVLLEKRKMDKSYEN